VSSSTLSAIACVCVGKLAHGLNLSIHIFIDVYTCVYVHMVQMFDLNAQKRVLSTATAYVCVGGWTHVLDLYIHVFMYVYIYILIYCTDVLPQRAEASAIYCHCVCVCRWIDSWTKFVYTRIHVCIYMCIDILYRCFTSTRRSECYRPPLLPLCLASSMSSNESRHTCEWVVSHM